MIIDIFFLFTAFYGQSYCQWRSLQAGKGVLNFGMLIVHCWLSSNIYIECEI